MKTYFQLIMEMNDYCPKSKGITSEEEIDMLDKHFGLSGMKEIELRNLRDMVVLYFDRQMEHCSDNAHQSDSLMQALMSITAVIDRFIYNVKHIDHEEA